MKPKPGDVNGEKTFSLNEDMLEITDDQILKRCMQDFN